MTQDPSRELAKIYIMYKYRSEFSGSEFSGSGFSGSGLSGSGFSGSGFSGSEV